MLGGPQAPGRRCATGFAERDAASRGSRHDSPPRARPLIRPAEPCSPHATQPGGSREAAAFFPGQSPADHTWTPFTVMPYIVMYNKKLVGDAEAPKAWKDVLDARWKGKVAYADATKSGSSYTLLVTWLTIYGKNDAGWHFVEALLRQSKVLPKSSMTYQMVANGEV